MDPFLYELGKGGPLERDVIIEGGVAGVLRGFHDLAPVVPKI